MTTIGGVQAAPPPDESFADIFSVDALAFVACYFWLSAFTGFTVAFEKGVAPFVLWDIVKMAFAAVTVAGVWMPPRLGMAASLNAPLQEDTPCFHAARCRSLAPPPSCPQPLRPRR